VSLFVLNPEIEDRDEFDVVTGRSTRRTSTLNDITGHFFNSMLLNFEIMLKIVPIDGIGLSG
jgi:hypothetical protein